MSAFEPLLNLEIAKDQILTKPPQLYQYDTVTIKEGGMLQINSNGNRWLILKAKLIICDGMITYLHFIRGIGTISYTFETGETIEHTYIESLGGKGGNGSANGKQAGGVGYQPIDHNGGGGGSGAYYTGTPRINVPGNNGQGVSGGPSPGITNRCFGGNGARRTSGHGGLICLIADKIVFGPKSQILLIGDNGADGENGGMGSCYGSGQVYYWGGGGGGGGTSGGNGGVLILKCKEVVNTPTVDVSPGSGGKGGAGGRSANCTYHGQDGMTGDIGKLGYVNYH